MANTALSFIRPTNSNTEQSKAIGEAMVAAMESMIHTLILSNQNSKLGMMNPASQSAQPVSPLRKQSNG